jgi:hypothetical protein
MYNQLGSTCAYLPAMAPGDTAYMLDQLLDLASSFADSFASCFASCFAS